MSDDIRQLLQRTHRGDREAAAVLWRSAGPRLTAYAAVMLGCGAGDAAAMDCVQSALCSLLSMRAHAIAKIEDPMAFLATAVRNAALQTRRVSRRERSHAERLREKYDPLHAEAIGGAERRNAEADEQNWLRQQIDTLEETDREIVLLRHVAGMTNEQIAMALQLNRNTVASRYRRALDGLRVRLGEQERLLKEPAALVSLEDVGIDVGSEAARGAAEARVKL